MAQLRERPEFQLSFNEWFAQKFGTLQMNEAQKTEIKNMFEKIRILTDIVDIGLNIEKRQERAIQHMSYTLSSRNQVTDVLSRREPTQEDTNTYQHRKTQYAQQATGETDPRAEEQFTSSTFPGNPVSPDGKWQQDSTHQYQAPGYSYSSTGSTY